MMRVATCLVIGLLLACGSSAPPPAPAETPSVTPTPTESPPSESPPSPADEPPPPPGGDLDVTRLGAACDEQGQCAAPMTCVRYRGIAGARGPEFSSCEIRCAEAKAACPAGTTCVTIADGPGAVCRPDVRAPTATP